MRFHLLVLCAAVAGCAGPLEDPAFARLRQAADGGTGCSFPSDCGTNGDTCSAGQCFCGTNPACGVGAACLNQSCAPIANFCVDTGSCATGELCVDNVCHCGASSACPVGQFCSGGACLMPIDDGGIVLDGGWLPNDGGTSTNTCAVTCTALGLGSSCNANNQCLCGGDVCGSGEQCHNGQCSAFCYRKERNGDDLPVTVCIGRPGFELGASVSMCGPNQFVAGAPGGSAMLRFAGGDAGWARASDAPNARFGESVLCRPQQPAFGGPGGLRVLNDGLWDLLWDRPAFALAPRALSGATEPLYLATARQSDGGHLLLRSSASSSALEPVFETADTAFGSSLVAGPYVAVGSTNENKGAVSIFKNDPPMFSSGIDVPLAYGAAALAMGDIMPGSGNDEGVELLVASTEKIVIFRNGALIGSWAVEDNLDPSLPGPPISLAVETRPLVPTGSVRAWWYGVPSLNLVHRCVGTYCFPNNPVTTLHAAFGASIATSGSTLVIGAPAYDGGSQGAVFVLNLDDFDGGGGAYTGEDQNCIHGTSCCTSKQQYGVCVGDAFCAVTTDAPPSALCGAVVDAGTDGGSSAEDAGVDGGSQPDAGTPDETLKPVEFGTCGCTSANGGFAVLLLAALALRRRAR